MLRKSKKQPQTVAEKVSKLLAHPNESDSAEDSDFDVTTGPRLVDFEEDEYDLPDARSTDFRKRNVKLLSEQSGVIITVDNTKASLRPSGLTAHQVHTDRRAGTD